MRSLGLMRATAMSAHEKPRLFDRGNVTFRLGTSVDGSGVKFPTAMLAKDLTGCLHP